MRDEFARLLKEALEEKVQGVVSIRIDDLGRLKIYIKHRGIDWYGNFTYINVDSFMQSGRRVDEIVKTVLWKYRGYLTYNMVTTRFFKQEPKEDSAKAYVMAD